LKYAAKVRAVPQPADLLQNHASAAHFFGQVAALYDQALGQFRALKPQSSVKAQWADTVSKFAALDTLVREIKAKAENADRSGIALLAKIKPLTAAANAAASGIGATKCGSS
jgi:transposase